jgi:sulfur carrier protein
VADEGPPVISVTVNGDEHALAPGTTVEQLLASLGVRGEGRGVAVALGGEVVPRSAWTETELETGALVEVVTAVQGG